MFLQLVSVGSLAKADMIDDSILDSACFLSAEEAVQEAREVPAIQLVLIAHCSLLTHLPGFEITFISGTSICEQDKR